MTIKGHHILGKLSRNLDKTAPRNCEARLTWELREREQGRVEFSARGEVWNHMRSDIISSGQNVDKLAALFPHDKRAQRIRETWELYHLNGMNAGTREQSAALEKGRKKILQQMRREGDASKLFYSDGAPNWYAIAHQFGHGALYMGPYDVDNQILAEAGLLEVPVTDELRAAALGGLPDGATTYKYGSRWLYYPIPEETLALIRNEFLLTDEDMYTTSADADEEPDRDLLAELGLTVDAVFIPWSQSRNTKEKQPSLNWCVTLKKDGHPVLLTDYMAGSAYCPAYSNRTLKRVHGSNSSDFALAIRQECETGREWKQYGHGKPILPDTKQVIASLLLDASSILNSAGLEDWCNEFGYDADSRKARKMFDTCMAHALAFRAAVGADKFQELQESVS